MVSNYPDPDPKNITFLLFDEAQDTYWDECLWNNFFKSVRDSSYRVILFCSYGSPSARPLDHKIGTPMVMHPDSRISLWPNEKDGIGLLLNQSEFNEVVEHFSEPLHLDPIFQYQVFRWTAGHAGVTVDMLDIISQQASDFSKDFSSLLF